MKQYTISDWQLYHPLDKKSILRYGRYSRDRSKLPPSHGLGKRLWQAASTNVHGASRYGSCLGSYGFGCMEASSNAGTDDPADRQFIRTKISIVMSGLHRARHSQKKELPKNSGRRSQTIPRIFFNAPSASGKVGAFSLPLFSPKFPQAFLRGGFRERTTQWDSFTNQPTVVKKRADHCPRDSLKKCLENSKKTFHTGAFFCVSKRRQLMHSDKKIL